MKLPVFVLIAMIGLAMGTLGCGEDNVEERVVISEIGQKYQLTRCRKFLRV
jgi:hypothetical protein